VNGSVRPPDAYGVDLDICSLQLDGANDGAQQVTCSSRLQRGSGRSAGPG
jgi:hypothetical protein